MRAALACIAGDVDAAVELSVASYSERSSWPPTVVLARLIAESDLAGRVVTALLEREPSAGTRDGAGHLQYQLHVAGCYDDAIAVGTALFAATGIGMHAYNVACGCAMAGDAEAAIGWLERAVSAGFGEAALLKQDEDLSLVRDDPRVQRMLAALGSGESAA